MSVMKEERFDQNGSFDQYLSFVDVQKHPMWVNADNGEAVDVVRKILYEMGADISKGWGIDNCLHRPRTAKSVVYGERYTFVERTDKHWKSTMMDVSDITRLETRSITATGMRLSLCEDRPVHQMMEVASLYHCTDDFENDDKEGK